MSSVKLLLGYSNLTQITVSQYVLLFSSVMKIKTYVPWNLVIVYYTESHWIVYPHIFNPASPLFCYSPLTCLRFPNCAQMTVLQVSDDREANLG